MFGSISAMIAGNQMLQAALVAGPTTALAWTAKALPMKIFNGTKKLVSIKVRFNSDSPDYEAVTRFVAKNVIYDKFSRNFNYQAETKWDSETYTDEVKNRGLTAGYGIHVGRYNGTFVIVDRYIEEGAQTEKFKEAMTVTFFTRSKEVVYNFAKDVAVAAGSNVDEFTNVPLYVNQGGWWSRAGKLPLRSIDTVFTANAAGQEILAAIREFRTKRDYHHSKGLPHRIGVLLFGKPGCGKSSLIHALASELGLSVYYLNLGSVENDEQLIKLVCNGRDWTNSMLVVEDFDATGAQTEARSEPTPDNPTGEPKKPVTLSALLNVFDGLIAPDGLITIATTNHPDKIDPALRRAGRFDQTHELGLLEFSDLARMADLFDKQVPAGIEIEPMSGADMRKLVMDFPEAA